MAAVQALPCWIIPASIVLPLCLCAATASESNRNYYDILNIEPAATDSQIKKAFRKLALKHHPDKNKKADAEPFREIAEAYTVLSHKDKRELYDKVGHEAFLKNGVSDDPADEDETSFPFHFSFSDSFHDFDDSLFVEETHIHWSFRQDWQDEESLFEHYSFEEPGFNFYFEDRDENEEKHFY